MPDRPPRTVLEQRIRERNLTLEEFVEHAERYAREHKETGTLSVRNLQRLVAGRHAPGAIRPATARLLEHILDETISELLRPPNTPRPDDHIEDNEELQRRLDTGLRVDQSVIRLLHEQLDGIRKLDRQLGALVVRDELTTKIKQVTVLMTHSLTPAVREQLAAVLSEMHTLAGWQALDTGAITGSWAQYEWAKAAALQSASTANVAHAIAEQAFVLLDLGRSPDALAALEAARQAAEQSAPRVLRAWLAAAHGEALAANEQLSASLQAFDDANELLPSGDTSIDRPYVALDNVHLSRWRGHALARFGAREAVAVLSGALAQLDPSFVRAETSLRVDLATALSAAGEHDHALAHAERAKSLAAQLGSARQNGRLRAVLASLS